MYLISSIRFIASVCFYTFGGSFSVRKLQPTRYNGMPSSSILSKLHLDSRTPSSSLITMAAQLAPRKALFFDIVESGLYDRFPEGKDIPRVMKFCQYAKGETSPPKPQGKMVSRILQHFVILTAADNSIANIIF